MKRMLHETGLPRQEGEDLVLSEPASLADGLGQGQGQENSQSDGVELKRWLVLIYRIPSEPSSARTALWRETRRLGALSLQHAVCLFPWTEKLQNACAGLVNRIADEYGGEATLFETTSPNLAWQEKMIERWNAARREEYEEVVDETERFHEEIARERRKGKFTFAELEDEESNLRRLQTYLTQVQSRDVFGASGRTQAQAEVNRCAQTLEIFAQEIYERQEGSGQPKGGS